MSLVPHTVFPRSMFDMDLWHRPFDWGPRALDVFDPFDDLDMQMNSAVNWVSRPSFLRDPSAQPTVPQKYRVTVECAGFNPQSIKTEIRGDKLVVSGCEGGKGASTDDDYHERSFKKTFKLPQHSEPDKMTSFMTSRGTLVVDIPYKMDASGQRAEDMYPTIVDKDGHKEVNLQLSFPESIDPAKVQVTAKDRDIIVKAEDKRESNDGFSQFHYYRRSTMPENTDMSGLKCHMDPQHKLVITAPVGPRALKPAEKPVPIEFRRGSK